MVTRTFFDKNNTIVYSDRINTGKNPVSELFYGGQLGNTLYSRLLFQFDETRLKAMIADGTYNPEELTHTLKLTNTGCFDGDLAGNLTGSNKRRTSSFDLVLFQLHNEWDEGNGYDYGTATYIGSEPVLSTCPSNWIDAKTNTGWPLTTPGSTVTGNTSGNTLVTQHFADGNENLEMDITDVVNHILTGTTSATTASGVTISNNNYGFGIAYQRDIETLSTTELQYVGFFTRHTQTFYEPYLETKTSARIVDDRSNFFLDKTNKLYLYTNLGNQPVNLDSNPTVEIVDQNDVIYSAYTSSAVTRVTKGVYSIDLNVGTTSAYTDCIMFEDRWKNIVINGVSRPDVTMDFVLKDSTKYYNFGEEPANPDEFGFSISGIRRDEQINRGDVRKVRVSARKAYTVNVPMVLDGLQYRLYVKEGTAEVDVIDWTDVARANNDNYFLLDTASLVPMEYFLDVKVTSNLDVRTLKNIISFDVVNEPTVRK